MDSPKKYKKKKPNPKHYLFTLYWWNPLIYIGIMAYFFICLWDGGIKEWLSETKSLITDYDWS